MPFYTYNPSNSQILHYDFLNWNVFATFRSISLGILKHHPPCSTLRTGAMSGIHLTEVPLYAEEEVTPHYQTVGILLIVGRNSVPEAVRLVQDIVNLEA